MLGAARLHYVLTQDEITSKSGTGRYVIEHLDPQWTQVAREALRIHETLVPQVCTPAKSAAAKMFDLPTWLVQDRTSRG